METEARQGVSSAGWRDRERPAGNLKNLAVKTAGETECPVAVTTLDMIWTFLFPALLLFSPAMAGVGWSSWKPRCFSNETQLEVEFVNITTKLGTYDLGGRTFASPTPGDKIKIVIFISNIYIGNLNKLPFRPVSINLTLSNIAYLDIRERRQDGTDYDTRFDYPYSDFNLEFKYYQPYLRKLKIVAKPLSGTIGQIFLELFSYCVRVRPSIPLDVANPCNGYPPFYYPYPYDYTYFIQCDAHGNAFVRPCAYNTVWNNLLQTCVRRTTTVPA